MVMKETSESIDKVCEKHGTTLSEWKKDTVGKRPAEV